MIDVTARMTWIYFTSHIPMKQHCCHEAFIQCLPPRTAERIHISRYITSKGTFVRRAAHISMLDKPFNYLSGVVGAPPDHLKVSSVQFPASLLDQLMIVRLTAHLYSLGFLPPRPHLHPDPLLETSIQGPLFNSDVMLLPTRTVQDVLGFLPAARG